MSSRLTTQFTTIASGDTLSGAVDLRNHIYYGFVEPVSLGSAVFLQVGHTANSADMARLLKNDGSADFSVASGPGGGADGTRHAVNMHDEISPFAFARVELDSAATDTRTFTFIGKATP